MPGFFSHLPGMDGAVSTVITRARNSCETHGVALGFEFFFKEKTASNATLLL